MGRPVRLAAVAGWHGDRKEAMLAQAKADPPADVLVGDWLAELTIGWAARERYVDRQKDPNHSADGYYMKTIVELFDRAVDTIVERKQKLITNGGGLSPEGCAKALEQVLQKHGHKLKIAYICGDDILDRFEELNQSAPMKHFDNGKELRDLHKGTWIGANAYIGAWGVVEALRGGADIVVTGRTTDASAIVAAAAWWHGWNEEQYDRLAQAVVCGHIMECSMYATGGNFSGYKALFDKPHDTAFPIAEIEADGSFIITKSPHMNGLVSRQTITAQILYEIQGNIYLNPDVQVDLHRVTVEDAGPDRVRVTGAKGFEAPSTAKCAVFAVGGYQAEAFAFATGLETTIKFKMFEKLCRYWLSTQPQYKFTTLTFQHVGVAAVDPKNELEATQTLRIFAQADRAEDFPPNGLQAMVEGLSMGTFPGFHRALDMRNTLPKLYMDFWPSLIPESELKLSLSYLHGDTAPLSNHKHTIPAMKSDSYDPKSSYDEDKWGPTVREPLGSIVMGRSGDKGGNANIGLYVRHADEYQWLRTFLDTKRFEYLLCDELKHITKLERVEFEGLLAVHFLCRGLLGEGVSNTSRLDGLAKSMIEFVRARVVDLPIQFVNRGRI
ncbi:hypothetical protein EDD37DRAFT_379078 [Exophiala viscosa]|uniref:uncharacterized protein n=1 Tax=Exophiala viscosa TaxID=2486360 RepID=UPI0021A10272|nr:hypothetical protein EDD37DRAFT_379078 [Exophiala viscosa]